MKKQVFLLIAFLTILILTSIAKAAPITEAEIEVEDIGEYSSRFVMEISCANVDLFTSEITDAGSGTGFIYRIDTDSKTGEKYALVFTNFHVVANAEYNKRHLVLQFSGAEDTKEEAQADFYFKSRLTDFSVLKFKMSQLSKELQARLRPARFPSKDSEFYNFKKNSRALQGKDVIALGNPLGGVNITTFGQITGIQEVGTDGPLILTQAPINPGNSGGPLISAEDGTVIGINVAKQEDADNMGYSIPIAHALEEFEAWEKDRTLGHARGVMLVATKINHHGLDVHGSKDLIEKAAPGYFKRNAGALLVHSTDSSSGLEVGDEIFKVNGEEVNMSTFNLYKAAYYSKDFIDIQLVRRHKEVLTVKVPLIHSQYRDIREKLDIVYLSGLLFVERNSAESFYSFGKVENRVWISSQVMTSQTNLQSSTGSFPLPESLVEAVRVEGVETKITTLYDLKKVLKALPEKVQHIELVVYEPLVQRTKDGSVKPVESNGGGAQLNTHANVFSIPVTKVLMYPVLDLRGFEEQFSLKQKDFKTRDFNEYTAAREKMCEEKLDSLKAVPAKEAKSSKRGPAWRKP